MNSFHAAMKVKISAVTTPGIASGSVTRPGRGAAYRR